MEKINFDEEIKRFIEYYKRLDADNLVTDVLSFFEELSAFIRFAECPTSVNRGRWMLSYLRRQRERYLSQGLTPPKELEGNGWMFRSWQKMCPGCAFPFDEGRVFDGVKGKMVRTFGGKPVEGDEDPGLTVQEYQEEEELGNGSISQCK